MNQGIQGLASDEGMVKDNPVLDVGIGQVL